MGKVESIAVISVAGVVAYAIFSLSRFKLPSFELPTFEWPKLFPRKEEPTNVSLTAGKDIPMITFTGTIPENYKTPRERQLEEQVKTIEPLVNIMESQQRAIVKSSGLTQEEIIQSEKLLWDAIEQGRMEI